MEISQQFQGIHVTPSPSGRYVASILSQDSLRINATDAPETRYSDISIRIQPRDVLGLRWSEKDDRVAMLSSKLIEVVDLDDLSRRVRLDNGSGGLGRFSEALFVQSEHLMVVWEFGKTKLWDLCTGKGWDVGEAKQCCDGSRWQMRPQTTNEKRPRILALLERTGAEDVLSISCPTVQKRLATVKLRTTDAQSLSWSPDGRWLAVLDVPTTNQNVHFFTPDGHLFKSCPQSRGEENVGLGIKAVEWAGNSQFVALTKFDGRILLLDTRTFTPLAVIEHTTIIDQRHPANPTPVWEETVSASGERSYKTAPQPFSPPLTRTKPSIEPAELGVAEAPFSSDGSWLATRDERMLNTVWIWNTTSLQAHAVIVQHNHVRKLHWHPQRGGELLIDCGEGIAYLFSPATSTPPTPISTSMSGNAILSWSSNDADSKLAILAATKSTFRLIYPEGVPEPAEPEQQNGAFEEGVSEDSIFDVLSGRTPMPAKTEQSYTERVDLEVETEEEDMTTKMDDTFRDKRMQPAEAEIDPLDDSDIF